MITPTRLAYATAFSIYMQFGIIIVHCCSRLCSMFSLGFLLSHELKNVLAKSVMTLQQSQGCTPLRMHILQRATSFQPSTLLYNFCCYTKGLGFWDRNLPALRCHPRAYSAVLIVPVRYCHTLALYPRLLGARVVVHQLSVVCIPSVDPQVQPWT